jgi:hypothetical protein
MSAGMRPVNFGHSIYLQEDPSIQNPIHKVLSTLISHKVHALLMGGQACVLYGAAEFSRDTDLVLLASDDNLALLRNALRELLLLNNSIFFAAMRSIFGVIIPMPCTCA